MNNSTETTTWWTPGRRLLLAGVTGAVLLGGGAGVAYAAQQDAPSTPISGYGTVVDERGAAVPDWPSHAVGDSTTNSGEDCPGWNDGSPDGGGSASPSEPTAPSTPDGDQL